MRPHFPTCRATLVLIAALTAAPALGAEGPGTDLPVQGSPPPEIHHYQPFPAQWNAPITIHGSHLLVSSGPPSSLPSQALSPATQAFRKAGGFAPRRTLVEAEGGPPSPPPQEGPEPVLKYGAGKQAIGKIPASDILSWTSTQIQIKQLPGVFKGAYWIAIYQNGKRVSNRNKTLFFETGDPDAKATLAPAFPDEEDEEDEPILLKVDYPPVEEPEYPTAGVLSYQPTVVGAGEEVVLHGVFPAKGNLRLVYGTGNKPIARIADSLIIGWTGPSPQIRFKNDVLPTGVYWVALFEGMTPVSNLNWSLQVTADPAPKPPPSQVNPQLIKSFPRQGQGQEQAVDSRLQRLPQGEGGPVVAPSGRFAPGLGGAGRETVSPVSKPVPARVRVKSKRGASKPSMRMSPTPAPTESSAEGSSAEAAPPDAEALQKAPSRVLRAR